MLYAKYTKIHCLALISSHCNWLFLSSRLSLLPQCSSYKSFQIVSKSAHQLVFGKVPGWRFESKVTFLSLKQVPTLFFLKHLSFANSFLELWRPAHGTAFPCGYPPVVNTSSLFLLSFLFVFSPLPQRTLNTCSSLKSPMDMCFLGSLLSKELEIPVLGGYTWKHCEWFPFSFPISILHSVRFKSTSSMPCSSCIVLNSSSKWQSVSIQMLHMAILLSLPTKRVIFSSSALPKSIWS